MEYLLGIDIGTSGTKTVLFDRDANPITAKTFEYPLYQEQNGWAEQEPNDWWEATVKGVQGVLEASGVNPADINSDFLQLLLEGGYVPVFCAITHDSNGSLLNTNADTIASQVACALSEFYDVTLTFCFEKPGVLSDADDDSSVISHITKETFQQLVADGVISGGMLPKLENAYDAINKGVARVMITRADNLDGSNGTLISE